MADVDLIAGAAVSRGVDTHPAVEEAAAERRLVADDRVPAERLHVLDARDEAGEQTADQAAGGHPATGAAPGDPGLRRVRVEAEQADGCEHVAVEQVDDVGRCECVATGLPLEKQNQGDQGENHSELPGVAAEHSLEGIHGAS